MRLRYAIPTVLLLASLTAGNERCPPRPKPTSVLSTYYSVPLGNSRNFLRDEQTMFLGHRVAKVRLRVRFFSPGRTDRWLTGLVVTFIAGPQSQVVDYLPALADAEGWFWTDVFDSNKVVIRVSTVGFVDYHGGSPRIEISRVDRTLLDDEAAARIPTASIPSPADSSVLRLPTGKEVVGFSPATDETQYYFVAAAPRLRSASFYLSPLALQTANDIGVQMGLSPGGFLQTPGGQSWKKPARRDSGIYEEMLIPPNMPMFVTVKTTLAGLYTLQFSELRETFKELIIERDEALTSAPDINTEYFATRVVAETPYNQQIYEFIRPIADYDRRIRESLVFASANALDASDGQLRFASARLHPDIEWWRNVDVQYRRCAGCGLPGINCRAYASPLRITMYSCDLDHPRQGGRTMHHEWGHFDYGLPDEYLDISSPAPVYSEALDPNSVMGTWQTTEFCGPLNHVWAEAVGGDESSALTQIADQYGLLSGHITKGRYNHGRYLDVLHRLDQLLDFTTN